MPVIPRQAAAQRLPAYDTPSTGTAEPVRRADGTAPRVLVADDDAAVVELLAMALRYEGWQVARARDADAALRAVRDFRPDAVVLDAALPGRGGLELLPQLRAHLRDLPVLLLSARDAVEDRIAGLSAGADDCVSKPFSLAEVAARLRGLLRRSGGAAAAAEAVLTVGDLTLDVDRREVVRDGRQIRLTATEFELLRCLMRDSGRVLSKEQLLDRVWHYNFGGRTNVVELYISYLRRKIDAGRAPMIHTVRRAGYVLKPAGPAH